VTVTAAATSGEVAAVIVSVTVRPLSVLTIPAFDWAVNETRMPALAPATKVFATMPLALEQPAVELTVNTIPVALATDPATEPVPVADSTTDAGRVTLIPGVWTTPTVTVLVPVGAGNARTVTV
jgi:hypothetical protein